jgi:hypothetical protein
MCSMHKFLFVPVPEPIIDTIQVQIADISSVEYVIIRDIEFLNTAGLVAFAMPSVESFEPNGSPNPLNILLNIF